MTLDLERRTPSPLSIGTNQPEGPRPRVKSHESVLRRDALERLADDRDRVAQFVENVILGHLVHEEREGAPPDEPADRLDLLLLAREVEQARAAAPARVRRVVRPPGPFDAVHERHEVIRP